MRSIVAISLLAFLSVTTLEIKAQTDIVDYLPLEVGNSWTLFDVFHPPTEVEPNRRLVTFTVVAEVIIDDTLYYDTGFLLGHSKLLRKDDLGRLWGFREGVGGFLFLDFTLDEGAVINYSSDHPVFPDYRLTISKSGPVDIRIGQLESEMHFTFVIENVSDADFSLTFSPDVGVISTVSGMGIRRELYSATIGGVILTDVIESDNAPENFTLRGNYPNPFSSQTTIFYRLAQPGRAQLQIYNVLGERVAVLEDRVKPTGEYNVSFDATGISSGVYLVTLTTGDVIQSRTMVLVK